ncbi:MAG: sugar ABC transporter permease [Anaerolineae bacterium]|nr:sugar ABC transporter permease [Anaerolineae bacterium]
MSSAVNTSVARQQVGYGQPSGPNYTTALGLAARGLLILVALVFTLFPVIWIISAAFNPSGSMISQTLIPSNVKSVDELFVNFQRLLNDPQVPFGRWIVNSLFVSITSTILSLMITVLAAYSFSRFRFRGRRNLMTMILLVQVFPNLLAMVAVYLMLIQIGRHVPILGLNQYGGLIMVYLGGAMGVNTLLVKGFFDTIPKDIDESALVDGATHWQTFWYLVFPLIRPILAVVALLAFVGTFNEFILARIILTDRNNWTLMVGLFNFVSAAFTDDWGVFAAGSLLAATPVVIVYIALQKYIVGGLTQGAVKE